MPRRVPLVGAVIVLAALAVTVIVAHRSAPPPHPVPNRAFLSVGDHARSEVWAVGDGADGSPAARTLAREIIRARPDRLLHLGDVYESGTAG